MKPPLYDAHNHLQDEALVPHHAEIFSALQEIGLRGAVVNGTCEDDWPAVAALAEQQAWVIPSYGVHPWFVAQRTPEWREKLRERLAHGGCALGEIGLDRWKQPFDFADQQKVFREQLALAVEWNAPVTIHCIEAWGALAEILHEVRLPECGFLIHAYGGSLELMPQFAALGGYFSYSGYFLLERKHLQRAIFAQIPPERLLVETDAPALPAPRECEEFALPDRADGTQLAHPANLCVAYRALAKLRGMPLEELAAQVEQNTRRLFGGAMRERATPHPQSAAPLHPPPLGQRHP
jgi:TatD DNase family protein